jgi:hypothetical protein
MSGALPDVVWRAYCLAQLPEALRPSLSAPVRHAVGALTALQKSSTDVATAIQALLTNGLDIELNAAWRDLDATLKADQRVVLYIDGLDTAFKDHLEVRAQSLQGLFVGWQASFAGLERVSLKAFLRTDLWDSLSFPEKSHLQTRILRLAWDESNLWRIVLKRALQSEGFRRLCKQCGVDPVLSPDQVERAPAESLHLHLDALFEQRIWSGKNSLTRKWVMRRLADAKDTVYPRDVLCLVKEAMSLEEERIQESKRVGTDTVLSRDAISEALLPTSGLRVQAVLEEYQELTDVLPQLRGVSAKGLVADLRSKLGAESDRHLELLVKGGVLDTKGEEYSVPPLYLHGLGMTRLGPR